MAIEFIDKENLLIVHIPNSEASVDAQHNGGKDTTVGSYYMSEKQPLVLNFLNDLDGDFYIDLTLVLRNSNIIINDLLSKGLENAFKMKLEPQKSALQLIEWLIEKDGPLYKIPNPTINENNKYLKLDNLNQAVETFRTLCLGEICDICFKKIGKNGYLLYNKKSIKYDKILSETIFEWVNK